MKKNPSQKHIDELVSQRQRPRHYSPVGESSRTKQAHKDECDINLIIKRHQHTGAISHLNPNAPRFGDFATPYDLKSAIDAVNEASATFEALSADIRAAAQNSPVQFLEMLDQEDGRAALADAGLDITVPQKPQDEQKKLIPQSGPPPENFTLDGEPPKGET